MRRFKGFLVVAGLLAMTTSALAATLYDDNINSGQYDARWQTVAGRTRFVMETGADFDGAVGYSDMGGGDALKCNAHILGGGSNLGVSNDLRDGSHFSDLNGTTPTTDVLVPADGYPLELQASYATFSTWPSQDVDWEISLVGDSHSVSIGSGAPSSNSLWYKIDSGSWTEVAGSTINSGNNVWNVLSMAIRPTHIIFGAELNGSGSVQVDGDFSDYSFHTIEVLSNYEDNCRAGYIGDINILGDPTQNIVPEPAAMLLLGLGLPLVARRRR